MSAVVEAAMGWVGTPYVHQGATRGAGCDCLGLVRGVWAELRGTSPEEVPNYTPDWGELGGQELLLDAARRRLAPAALPRAGDVLLFRMRARSVAKHLGIDCGGGRFVHAYRGHGVIVSPLSEPWARRIAARFVLPDQN